ncbi:MAG TPA: DnaJ domain-containing protein [Spirochaetota bacterium]|nr:DnaJ domain-containing protein [Spirochaetota bacterium]HQP48781.1 DnaJ domain-containing protein [Spirochaetota bacterium]
MKTTFAFKDYYRILGIAQSSAAGEVKTAFRKLARETHPDLSGDPRNYERFVLIREAYDVLTDEKKRAEYDSVWKQYTNAGNDIPDETYVDSVLRDFFDRDESSYRDEWEYFVQHPEDYLGLFESTLKIISATLLSLGAGIVAPFAVFGAIVVMAGFLFAAVIMITAALVTTSLSSVAGVIMAVLLYRRIKMACISFRLVTIRRVGRIVVKPLRGIPKRIGKWVLFSNYTVVLILMCVAGYFVVIRFYDWIMDGSPYMVEQFLKSLGLMVFLISLVMVFSISVIMIYEIISEALDLYPPIRYTRIAVRSKSQIVFQKN